MKFSIRHPRKKERKAHGTCVKNGNRPATETLRKWLGNLTRDNMLCVVATASMSPPLVYHKPYVRHGACSMHAPCTYKHSDVFSSIMNRLGVITKCNYLSLFMQPGRPYPPEVQQMKAWVASSKTLISPRGVVWSHRRSSQKDQVHVDGVSRNVLPCFFVLCPKMGYQCDTVNCRTDSEPETIEVPDGEQ